MTVRHLEHHSHPVSAGTGSDAHTLFGSMLAAFSSVWNAAEDLYAKVQRRQGIRTMLELDDHLLRDMGVTRADVLRAARLPLSESAGRELAHVSRRNRHLR